MLRSERTATFLSATRLTALVVCIAASASVCAGALPVWARSGRSVDTRLRRKSTGRGISNHFPSLAAFGLRMRRVPDHTNGDVSKTTVLETPSELHAQLLRANSEFTQWLLRAHSRPAPSFDLAPAASFGENRRIAAQHQDRTFRQAAARSRAAMTGSRTFPTFG